MFGKLPQEIPVFKASRQTAQLTSPAHPNPTSRSHVRRPNPETPRRIAASLSTRPIARTPQTLSTQIPNLRLFGFGSLSQLARMPHAAAHRNSPAPHSLLSGSPSQTLSLSQLSSASPLLGSWWPGLPWSFLVPCLAGGRRRPPPTTRRLGHPTLSLHHRPPLLRVSNEATTDP